MASCALCTVRDQFIVKKEHLSLPLLSHQEVINTGLFHMKSTCRHCHGQGKVITTPCMQCGGRGTTTQSQQINVQVPAGVSDGQTVRVPVGSSEAHVLLQVIPQHSTLGAGYQGACLLIAISQRSEVITD